MGLLTLLAPQLSVLTELQTLNTDFTLTTVNKTVQATGHVNVRVHAQIMRALDCA